MNLPAIDEFEDTDLFFPDGDCVSDVEEESGYKAFNTDDTNVSSENKMGDIAAFRIVGPPAAVGIVGIESSHVGALASVALVRLGLKLRCAVGHPRVLIHMMRFDVRR
eukprot:gene12378-15565_t